jgi:hypothetical protein
LCVAVVALLLGIGDAWAGSLIAVQSGTTSSAANGTTTVTISNVDTTRSFLVFNVRSNSGRPPGSTVRGRLASSTTIEFVRVTDETSTINIQWYVATFSAGVSVQRGEVTLSTTTVNVTLGSAVSAVNKAFVLWSKTPGAADQEQGTDDFVVGELTTTSNLQFRADGSSASQTIAWQVVEFTDTALGTVQKGTTSLTGATLSTTATLTSVDTAKTFLLTGYRASGGGSTIGARMVRAELTNATTVTIDRSITGPTVTRANAWTTGLTHTAGSGSNRVLVFAVGYENGADPGISSISYGGQAMTRAVQDVAGTSIYNRVELWYLKEVGIDAATNSTFSVTWGGTAPADPMYAAATFAEVNQTTPIATTSSNSSDAATPNPITTSVSVQAHELTVSAVITGNSGSYTWNNSFAEGTDQTSGATTNMSTADRDATSNGTHTASATHSGPNRQAIVAAVLNQQTDDVSEAVWQAVELGDASVVQRGTASFAAGVAQQTASITTVKPNRTIAFASVQPSAGQSMGKTPYESDDVVGVCSVTISVAPTQITLDRNNTAEACDVGWFVVEFAKRRVVVSRSGEGLEGAMAARGDREPQTVEAERARAEDVLSVDHDAPPAQAARAVLQGDAPDAERRSSPAKEAFARARAGPACVERRNHDLHRRRLVVGHGEREPARARVEPRVPSDEIVQRPLQEEAARELDLVELEVPVLTCGTDAVCRAAPRTVAPVDAVAVLTDLAHPIAAHRGFGAERGRRQLVMAGAGEPIDAQVPRPRGW